MSLAGLELRGGGMPSPEELAAIVAAVEVVLLEAAAAPACPTGPAAPPWRFSGRWWSRPIAARRERPWAR